jgi:hypothetical protein
MKKKNCTGIENNIKNKRVKSTWDFNAAYKPHLVEFEGLLVFGCVYVEKGGNINSRSYRAFLWRGERVIHGQDLMGAPIPPSL